MPEANLNDLRQHQQASTDGMQEPAETLDQVHERLGHTAPRITEADINAAIVEVEFVKHVAKSGQVLRWAVLTMRNGFAVTGKPSASVSPANDSAELGEKFALANARGEVWALMAYELKQRLYERTQPPQIPAVDER